MTERGRSQFIGLAGQYHVAFCLSVRQLHAAMTLGNVPDIDLLISSVDGANVLSLQVKTSRSAHRRKRYGHELREWDVGSVAKPSPNRWYAFVDLLEYQKHWKPKVFLVPSQWVHGFVKTKWKRKMFLLPQSLWEETEEQWERITNFLNNEPLEREWVNSFPEILDKFWEKRMQ